jgi:phage baseplate assembly protein W
MVNMGVTVYGISFPFRVGVSGGIEMSKTDINDPAHVEESIIQILSTPLGTREMENFGCQLSTHLFDPEVEATYNLLKFEIVDALTEFEPRIRVTMKDISISASEDGNIYATISYELVSSAISGSLTVNLGGVENGR